MEQQILDLLNEIESKGYDCNSFIIPNELVELIQEELNLRNYNDKGLYDLWFEVETALNNLKEEYRYLVLDWKHTILGVINASKSFNQGILDEVKEIDEVKSDVLYDITVETNEDLTNNLTYYLEFLNYEIEDVNDKEESCKYTLVSTDDSKNYVLVTLIK